MFFTFVSKIGCIKSSLWHTHTQVYMRFIIHQSSFLWFWAALLCHWMLTDIYSQQRRVASLLPRHLIFIFTRKTIHNYHCPLYRSCCNYNNNCPIKEQTCLCYLVTSGSNTLINYTLIRYKHKCLYTILSNTFYSSLKTLLFSHTRVGNASE